VNDISWVVPQTLSSDGAGAGVTELGAGPYVESLGQELIDPIGVAVNQDLHLPFALCLPPFMLAHQ
jgi:hypothetical protein